MTTHILPTKNSLKRLFFDIYKLYIYRYIIFITFNLYGKLQNEGV